MCRVLELPRSTYYYESTVTNTKDFKIREAIYI